MRWSSMTTSKGCASASSSRFSVRKQRPRLIRPHALHQTINSRISQQRPPPIPQTSQLNLRAPRIRNPGRGQIQRRRHERTLRVRTERSLIAQRLSGLRPLRRGQQHEVTRRSHAPTLSRPPQQNSTIYHLDGETHHSRAARLRVL